MHHQYHHLTPNMKRALARLGEGLKYIDIRSGAALHRRGLARWDAGNYRAYFLTETGADVLARGKARERVCRWIVTEKKHLDQVTIDAVMEYAAWATSQ